jgi:diguanylate cyclase (GGDEF)-like protein
LNANLREADLPGVYNGNFLVILPATTEAGARVAAERLVGTLSPKQVLRNGETFEISICIGIVSHPGGKGISMARLLAAAPQALAQAQKKTVPGVWRRSAGFDAGSDDLFAKF